jgi:hypothetical protein
MSWPEFTHHSKIEGQVVPLQLPFLRVRGPGSHDGEEDGDEHEGIGDHHHGRAAVVRAMANERRVHSGPE